MTHQHPHVRTNWKSATEDLARMFTEMHPEFSEEVLAVISANTTAVMKNTTIPARRRGKEQEATQ